MFTFIILSMIYVYVLFYDIPIDYLLNDIFLLYYIYLVSSLLLVMHKLPIIPSILLYFY